MKTNLRAARLTALTLMMLLFAGSVLAYGSSTAPFMDEFDEKAGWVILMFAGCGVGVCLWGAFTVFNSKMRDGWERLLGGGLFAYICKDAGVKDGIPALKIEGASMTAGSAWESMEAWAEIALSLLQLALGG